MLEVIKKIDKTESNYYNLLSLFYYFISMNYKKQKAIEDKKKRIIEAKEKMKTMEAKDYGYYNVITGQGYSIKNQMFLASQWVPFGWVIRFSDVYKRNDSLKKKERVRDIRKWCKTASVIVFKPYKKKETTSEGDEVEHLIKWFGLGNVLSVSDLLLDWEQVNENYSWFLPRLESEEDIDCGIDFEFLDGITE